MWKFAESLDSEELPGLDMRADRPEWLTEREYKFFGNRCVNSGGFFLLSDCLL
jgi:hypothetical protein